MDRTTDSGHTAVSPSGPGEETSALTLRCWGTRGSIPSPGPATAEFGGNTTCLELRAGDRRIIFDAGSGIRLLGQDIIAGGGSLEATIFLTHFHWDHIQGFPFFVPLYNPEARLRIVGPMQRNIDVKSLFAGQMGPIYFPVPFSAVAATTSFEHLNEGSLEIGDLVISAIRMRHPAFTVGYRIEGMGRKICFIPDNELEGGEYEVGEDWRERLVEFVGGSDLLLHDAMFTDEEYPTKIGWGHSTFRQAMALAHEGGVKKLLFFHHAPERTDAELEALLVDARDVAREENYTFEIEGAREGADFHA